jgi:peptidoglycan hydrolase FlgJ
MAITIGPNNVDPLHAQRTTTKVDANDFKRFNALRADARSDDPAALREVARQFESIFTKMMLESMRSASFGDPLFGSDQADMYQDMMDDQLAVEMSQGKGLGLADMLIRQLSHGANLKAPGEVTDAASRELPLSNSSGLAPDDAAKRQFIEKLLPHAEAAARELGVDARAIVAQAALETGWGRSRPADARGGSNNLFGIKAGGSWNGAAVASLTTEYDAGVAHRELARFRAYASAQDGVQDYVSLLRDNPRYSAALNTGHDVRAFATALQRGGYATDPDYANKLMSVFDQLERQLGERQEIAASLKAGHAGPLTPQES